MSPNGARRRKGKTIWNMYEEGCLVIIEVSGGTHMSSLSDGSTLSTGRPAETPTVVVTTPVATVLGRIAPFPLTGDTPLRAGDISLVSQTRRPPSDGLGTVGIRTSGPVQDAPLGPGRRHALADGGLTCVATARPGPQTVGPCVGRSVEEPRPDRTDV